MDEFRSPVVKLRSLSVRRKNTTEEVCEKHCEYKKSFLQEDSHQNPHRDDTMYDVDELDFDKEIQAIQPNKNELFDCQKITKNELNLDDFKSSEFGFCSICKMNIPTSECSSHHSTCLKNKFGSSHKSCVMLNSGVICSTCGSEIEISEYVKHIEACKKSNIEVAQKLTGEVVTSSYFPTRKESSIESFSCPSCAKDLTNLDTPQRLRHANM